MNKLLGPAARALALVALFGVPSCDEAEPSLPDLGEMFASVEDHVWHNGYEDGDWDPDWDDAPFYGLGFYARAGWDWDVPRYQGRALEALDRNMAVNESGLADPTGELVDNSSAILYGTLGIIEYMVASGDMEPLEQVDEVIDLLDAMLQMLDDYVQGFEGSYSIDTYGPTSITAVFTMAHLQYATLLDTDRRQDRIDRAREIAARVEELTWNGTYYQFDPTTEDELFLYPNVAMMIVNTRLAELTGEASYLQRAEEVYDAIQPLKYDHRPGYHSPYSAEVMGAQTDDYTTLSSQNYAMLAFALLAEHTGDPLWREELDALIDFVETYLWVEQDGRIYHHWMDGRLAVPEDPEYYCIGCNLQVLYILWWVDEHLP